MKTSTSWIKKSLRRTMSDRQIADALELAGIEVEQLISSTPIDPLIVVGLVKKCIQHPNADRLKIVQVELARKTLTIVCGAPNVRVGLKVAVAQVGATLPSGDIITRAKLRGEISEGMLCSGRELALSDDHKGLIELDSELKSGTKLADLYPADGQLDIKTAANRPDLQSIVGLAREVAALSKNELVMAQLTPRSPSKSGPVVKVDVTPDVTARFVLAELKLKEPNHGVVAERAAWLRTSGMRAVSPLVDITNYVMLEQGQPLHAYDADKVKGALTVRHAKTNEKLVTLDGVVRRLTHEDLIIADDSGPIGLAGVMGGAATEVDAKTKRIYLEAATFRGATIRKMAKRHGLRSEASARFERGLPVQLAPLALTQAIELVERELGAKLVGLIDELRVWPWVQRIGLRKSRLERLLGIKLTANEVVVALARLGIEAKAFNMADESKLHLGKPYIWGASYKTDGVSGFDCSYLVDYTYSLIGLAVGHTAEQQFESGIEVKLADLQPGDTLFRDGAWDRLKREDRGGVSHVAIYIGHGKIIHAESHEYVDGEWRELPKAKQKVMIDPLEAVTEAPGYLGARRYAEELDDFISVPEVPWWRPDLKLPEDLVEEVVRVIGYDRIPSTLPAWQPRELTFDRQRSWRRRLREILFGSGLFEVMTYSFVSKAQLLELGSEPKHYLKLANPLSSEQAYLRRSPLPNLLSTLARNAKYGSEVGLYEVTAVFEPQAKGKLPKEPERLAVIYRTKEGSYAQVKGILDRLSAALGLGLTIEPSKDTRFAYGRSGVVRLAGKEIGWIGQLTPALAKRHKLSGEVAYLELGLEVLLAAAQPVVYRPVSRFPLARRDLAVVVAESITWQQLHDEAIHTDLAQVSFLSDYHGDDLPAGHKSVALRLEMSSSDHTLTEAEVEDRLRVIQGRLKKRLGAVPRSIQ
jgi:phenylalanyl-tRNA synthetase beta subunit